MLLMKNIFVFTGSYGIRGYPEQREELTDNQDYFTNDSSSTI